MLRSLPALALALALGCTSRSEIVLRIDSDYVPGMELRAVDVMIVAETGGSVWSHHYPLAGAALVAFPISLGIVPLGQDPSRRVRVSVDGLDASGVAFTHWTAVAGFTAGQTTLLDAYLARACEHTFCSTPLVCDRGLCRAPDAVTHLPVRPGDELDAERPDVTIVDAGRPDVGGLCRFTGDCDLALDDCDPGLTCRFDTVSETTTCRAVGSHGIDQACASVAQCGPGFTCDVDSYTRATLCLPFCCESLACPTGRRCFPWPSASGGFLSVGGCLHDDGCDPAAQTGCPSGQACYLSRVVTACVAPGSIAEGARCARDFDCAPGLSCFRDTSGAGGASVCRTLCDTRRGPCADSRSCLSTDATPPYDWLGVCS